MFNLNTSLVILDYNPQRTRTHRLKEFILIKWTYVILRDCYLTYKRLFHQFVHPCCMKNTWVHSGRVVNDILYANTVRNHHVSVVRCRVPGT
jgi:hypothetical protein